MTRLPFEKLHLRLDDAFLKYPESPTLNDFRANKNLIYLENKALNKARKIITPHNELAEMFKNKVVRLNWHVPTITKIKKKGGKVLFPASAVGRKGAYEIKNLAKELNLKLTATGIKVETLGFWEDVKVERFNGNFEEIGLIVYPTYVENQPRLILRALAYGIPVIASSACGIENMEHLTTINIKQFKDFNSEVLKHYPFV